MEVLAFIGAIAIITGLVVGIWRTCLWVIDVNFKLSEYKQLHDTLFEVRSDMRKTHRVLSELVALNELQQPNMLVHISPELLESEVCSFCNSMYDELNQFYLDDRYTRSKDNTVYKRLNVLKTHKED